VRSAAAAAAVDGGGGGGGGGEAPVVVVPAAALAGAAATTPGGERAVLAELAVGSVGVLVVVDDDDGASDDAEAASAAVAAAADRAAARPGPPPRWVPVPVVRVGPESARLLPSSLGGLVAPGVARGCASGAVEGPPGDGDPRGTTSVACLSASPPACDPLGGWQVAARLRGRIDGSDGAGAAVTAFAVAGLDGAPSPSDPPTWSDGGTRPSPAAGALLAAAEAALREADAGAAPSAGSAAFVALWGEPWGRSGLARARAEFGPGATVVEAADHPGDPCGLLDALLGALDPSPPASARPLAPSACGDASARAALAARATALDAALAAAGPADSPALPPPGARGHGPPSAPAQALALSVLAEAAAAGEDGRVAYREAWPSRLVADPDGARWTVAPGPSSGGVPLLAEARWREDPSVRAWPAGAAESDPAGLPAWLHGAAAASLVASLGWAWWWRRGGG